MKLSVIVVTYNSAAILEPCLSALPRRDDMEIIVVDNASDDSSPDVARRLRPDATVVSNGSNAGFAIAVNRGSEIASGEILLLLNPDAAIVGTEIAKVLSLLDSRPDVGIAAPLVHEREGAFRTLAVGFAPNLRRMFTHATGLSRLGRRWPALIGHYVLRDQIESGKPMELDWVSGGCMFVRHSLWMQLGGLSERWFMYAEDIEFCLRARKVGARVVLDPDATARHEVGGSSGRSDHVNTMWLSNLFDLYRSSIARNRLQVALWRWTVIAGYDLRALALRVLAPTRVADRARFRAYAAALRTQGA